jgi:dihydroneopterin aldolase
MSNIEDVSAGNDAEFLDCDFIQIERIKVSGHHGVSASERESSRPLEIEITLRVDLSQAATTDNLADTVNYSTICSTIVKLVEDRSYKLLERLAAEILDVIFVDNRIKFATVKISKPERLAGATPSITLARRNTRPN